MRVSPGLSGVVVAFCLAEQPGGGLFPIAVAALSTCLFFVAEALVAVWRKHVGHRPIGTVGAP